MRPIGRIFAAAAVGSMALGLAACTTSSDSSAPAADTKTGDSSGATKVDTSTNAQDWEKAAVKGDGTKTIYLVSKGFQHRFWQAVKEGAEQAGEELGYQVKFVGPQDETKVTEQTDQLKSALDSGPAAIGFAALDSKAAADLLDEINKQGIPVVAFEMASTRMRSGKLRFIGPIVGDEARHGRARLARGRHSGARATGDVRRDRAPTSCESDSAGTPHPRARAGEAEEGGVGKRNASQVHAHRRVIGNGPWHGNGWQAGHVEEGTPRRPPGLGREILRMGQGKE